MFECCEWVSETKSQATLMNVIDWIIKAEHPCGISTDAHFWNLIMLEWNANDVNDDVFSPDAVVVDFHLRSGGIFWGT